MQTLRLEVQRAGAACHQNNTAVFCFPAINSNNNLMRGTRDLLTFKLRVIFSHSWIPKLLLDCPTFTPLMKIMSSFYVSVQLTILTALVLYTEKLRLQS